MSDLVAFLNARLDEDEATAKASVMPEWMISESGEFGYIVAAVGTETTGESIADAWQEDVAVHIARHDPARVLRRVKATRDLVAVILAERHDYNDGDEFYSCSQAVEHGTGGEPGSGCANDERAGRPCDCGRDARVARLLGIIASEWQD